MASAKLSAAKRVRETSNQWHCQEHILCSIHVADLPWSVCSVCLCVLRCVARACAQHWKTAKNVLKAMDRSYVATRQCESACTRPCLTTLGAPTPSQSFCLQRVCPCRCSHSSHERGRDTRQAQMVSSRDIKTENNQAALADPPSRPASRPLFPQLCNCQGGPWRDYRHQP